MLDYRIKSFMAMVESGTLKKASEKLGLTQPAVSQHLKSLESSFGISLFDHVGRRLLLNDAGRLLNVTAEKAEALFLQFRREAALFPGGIRHYHIAATLTVGEFILPRYLGLYRKKNPMIELTIGIENTVTVLELLDKGKIDLAIVEGPFDSDQYLHRLFMRDEMIFIDSRDQLGNRDEHIGREELKKSRLILREIGSGTRFYWEEYCLKNGIVLPKSAVVMEVGSLSAIKSLVEAGIGCSVMSRRAVEKELMSGTLITRSFVTGPLYRNMYFIYKENSPVDFVEDFIAFCSRSGI